MININEVLETNKMIEKENLDVRTITLGISLLDCIDSDLDKLNKKIYNKITTVAENLVATGEAIEKEFGIPIVNKRISVTPIALIGGSACKTSEDFVTIAKTLDRARKDVGVNFLGGYSALVSKGMTKADELLLRSIPQALAETELVCSSVNLGSTKTGIDMDAVRLMGDIIKETAELTKDNDSIGCSKLVVFCNAPDDNPFMAGAFHGVTEADAIINVGVSGPGVVKNALENVRGENFEVLCETIKKTAFKVTRVGQLVAQEASKRLGIPFGIVDLSLAPTPAIGDSVADILCEIGLEYAGAPGTTAALALLNDQVKKGGVMASSYVGGLSGAFIPVSEDQGNVVELRCVYDPASRGGQSPDGRKVKGTLHWVSAKHAKKAQTRLYEQLFSVPDPDNAPEGGTFIDNLNPDSLKVVDAWLEPALENVETGKTVQFERLGYFCKDPASEEGAPVFNRTATLRDTWAKIEKKSN